MTCGSPAPTPYPYPQTPYPSRVRVCITCRWTRVVAIPVSPRGYTTVFHTRDCTNVPCVSRDTTVLAGAVTNAVTRAIWPSSTRWRGHRRRRSPSWILVLLLRVVRRPSSVFCRRCPSSPSSVLHRCRRRRRLSSSSVLVVLVVVRRRSLSGSHRRRRRHRNRTANWPSPGMTTSSCGVRVGRPRVALVVGRRGCCCAVQVGVRGSGHAPVPGGGRTTNPARTLSAVVHRRRRRHPHGLANGPEPMWTVSSAVSRHRRRLLSLWRRC